MADLAVWQRTIVDEEGNVIPGAEIEVRREEDDSLATLYADRAGETPLANPLAADMSGFVRFFAQGDAYTITAVGAGSTRTWRFDPTGRLQEFDRVSEALGMADGADTLETRQQLGEFATVADVEARHIPPVLDSIRTNSRAIPGDGGGALLIEGSPSDPGAFQDANGKWWKVAEKVVRPQMFGAVGDGTADDSNALDATVNFALLTGADIYWPEGDYLTSRSIPGLHGVRHTGGPGKVRRGSRTFQPVIQETETNLLYLAPDGDDANDGLTPDEPIATLGRFKQILLKYGPFLKGSWRLVCAAGTYTQQQFAIGTTEDNLQFQNRLVIEGPSSDHPDEPVAIFDGENEVTRGVTVWASRVSLRHLSLKNYTQDCAMIRSYGDAQFINIHAGGAGVNGINIEDYSIAELRGGKVYGNGSHGIRVYKSTLNTQALGAGGYQNGVQVDGNPTGIRLQEGYLTGGPASITNSATFGVYGIYGGSRGRITNWYFEGNATDIVMASGAVVQQVGNIFADGHPKILYGSGSMDVLAVSGSRGVARFVNSDSATVTGSTGLTQLRTIFSIPANYFIDNNKAIKVRAWGTASGSGGAKTVGVYFWSQAIAVPSNQIDAGNVTWVLEATITPTGPSSQRYIAEVFVDGVRKSPVVGNRTAAMDVERNCVIAAQLQDANDSLTVEYAEAELIG